MNKQEACNLLGVNMGDSMESVDKAFKKLALKFHPDRNKDNQQEAEKKFKQINEAYQFLKKYGTKKTSLEFDQVMFDAVFGGFNRANQYHYKKHYNNYSDIFYDVFNKHNESYDNIVNIRLTFEESINGCNKTIKVPVSSVCEICSGQKFKFIKTDREPCSNCNATGVLHKDKDVSVIIYPGIYHGSIVNIVGTNSKAKILVDVDPDMKRDGDDVISIINISLLEALKGTCKVVRTVNGEKVLKIPPKIKNKTFLRINGFGVKNKGSHIFTINVDYPEDVSDIIQVLEKGLSTSKEVDNLKEK